MAVGASHEAPSGDTEPSVMTAGSPSTSFDAKGILPARRSSVVQGSATADEAKPSAARTPVNRTRSALGALRALIAPRFYHEGGPPNRAAMSAGAGLEEESEPRGYAKVTEGQVLVRRSGFRLRARDADVERR